MLDYVVPGSKPRALKAKTLHLFQVELNAFLWWYVQSWNLLCDFEKRC